MKKLFVLIAVMAAVTTCQAGLHFSIGVGVPVPGVVISQPPPVVVAPPPVVYQAPPAYYAPPPVVYAPAPPPVVYQPAPVICAPSAGFYFGFGPARHGHYHRGWRH